MSLKDLFDPAARRHFLQLWSNQLSIAFAAIMAFLVEQPDVALRYIEHVPQPWRSLAVFFVTAIVPILIRMARQPKLEARIAAEQEAPLS